MFASKSDCGGGECSDGCSAVFGALAGKAALLRHPVAECVAVKRFRSRFGKERVCEKARARGFVDAARRCQGTMLVLWVPRAQPQEIINERIPRPRIE